MSVEYSTDLYFGCRCDEHYNKVLDILDSLPESEEKEELEGAAEEYFFHLNAWSGEGVFFGERVSCLRESGYTYSLKELLSLRNKYEFTPSFMTLYTFLVKQIPDFPKLDFYIVNTIY